MRFLLLSVVLFLAGCAGSKPLYHIENDAFSADFYTSTCSNKKVLALTGPVTEVVKDGVATFKEPSRVVAFCYIADEEQTQAFIIDEDGDRGFVELKK